MLTQKPKDLLKSKTAPTAADALAKRLRGMILDGIIRPGEQLIEREISAEAGLGRSSVREALRKLESEGLLSTRPGRNGGSRVLIPNARSMAKSVEIYVLGNRVRVRTLLEARQVLESGCTRILAERRSPTVLAELENLQAQMQTASQTVDLNSFVNTNIAWHLAIVRATDNPLLVGFMEGVVEAIQKSMRVVGANTTEARNQILAEHRAIIDAIATGDARSAMERMYEHLTLNSEKPGARARIRVL